MGCLFSVNLGKDFIRTNMHTTVGDPIKESGVLSVPKTPLTVQTVPSYGNLTAHIQLA